MPDSESNDTSKALVGAFMKALTETPYNEIDLRKIADEAEVPFAQAVMLFPRRIDFLESFAEQIDAEVLAGDDPEMVDEPVRERLFDVLMRRYDALRPYKPALRALRRAARQDPSLALAMAPMVDRALRRMAAGAGLPLDGLQGMVTGAGLLQLHLGVLDVWLDDEDEGQAKTMAALDSALRQAERRANDMDRMGKMMMGRGGPTGGPLCRLRHWMETRRGVEASPDTQQEAA